MAPRKRLIAPEAEAALTKLTLDYAGTLPAKIKIYWIRPAEDGGPMQLVDDKSIDGLFELGMKEIGEGRLEEWLLQHPLLGGNRSYSLAVYTPNNDGGYASKPNKVFQLRYADPMENAAIAAQNRAGATAAAVNAVVVAAAEVNATVAQAVSESAAAAPEKADALGKYLNDFTRTLGDAMATFNRLGSTPITPGGGSPLQQVAQPQWGAPAYPMAMPYGYPPPPMPYGYPPQGGGESKMADALVALVSARPAPSTDPTMLALLQKLVEKQDVKPSGIDPTIQRQFDEMKIALAEAKAEAQRAKDKAESDKREFELRAEIAEMKRLIAGGTASKPNEALEFAKLQMQQQAESAKQHNDLMLKMQEQSNGFNAQLREILSEPGPDQSQQLKQMAGAMSEVTNTMMGMMSQVMRMGGGGGEPAGKQPAWMPFAEKMIGIAAGLGQSITQSVTDTQGAPQMQMAPQQQQAALPPAPAPQLAPAGPSKFDLVIQAKVLAARGDVENAIRTLDTAMRQYPEMVQANPSGAPDKVRTAVSLLEDVVWPDGVTPASLTGAYVAVFGADAQAVLQDMVAEAEANGETVEPGPNLTVVSS
jgi:hypothetical protein